MLYECCDGEQLLVFEGSCLYILCRRNDLQELADSYMLEHFKEMVDCEEFNTVSPQHLADIIGNDDLNVDSEIQARSLVVYSLVTDRHSRYLHTHYICLCVCSGVRGCYQLGEARYRWAKADARSTAGQSETAATSCFLSDSGKPCPHPI